MSTLLVRIFPVRPFCRVLQILSAYKTVKQERPLRLFILMRYHLSHGLQIAMSWPPHNFACLQSVNQLEALHLGIEV